MRQAAIGLGGAWARRLRVTDIALRWGSGVAAVVLVVVAVVTDL